MACDSGAWLWVADAQQSALQDRHRSGKVVRVAGVTAGRVGADVAKPAV